jgi:ABC-type transport system substrate-binding protein
MRRTCEKGPLAPDDTLEEAIMPTFYHALEGPPENLAHFLGKTERDIRVRWLVADEAAHGAAGLALKGPWAAESIDDQGISLRRSKHWPPKAAGNIDEIRLRYLPDGRDVAAGMMKGGGDLHFAPSLTDPGSFAELRSHPEVEMVAAGNISTFFLTFRLEKVGEQLRKRVASAIDVQALAALWREAARPAIALIPHGMPGHDWGKHERTEISGPEVTLTLLCPPPTTFPHALAIEIQRQLRPAGINVTLSLDFGGFPTWKAMSEAWKAGNGDLLIAGWHQRTPYPDDPQPYLRALFHSKGGANWSRYGQADGHIDFRRPKRAVERLKADVPAVPLVYWTRYSAYRKGIGLELQAGGLPKDRLVNVTL